MGMHIVFCSSNKILEFEWDSLRYHEDCTFIDIYYEHSDNIKIIDEEDTRPIDINILRKDIEKSKLENKQRYINLCDLLEKDINSSVFISY